jgi:hypothetical protein
MLIVAVHVVAISRITIHLIISFIQTKPMKDKSCLTICSRASTVANLSKVKLKSISNRLTVDAHVTLVTAQRNAPIINNQSTTVSMTQLCSLSAQSAHQTFTI